MNLSAGIEFKKYIDKQIVPSVEDIKELDDNSRKHVQKLVYTNLVDRFDVMVDYTILENCRSDFIIDEIRPALRETVNESYLLQLLMNAESARCN